MKQAECCSRHGKTDAMAVFRQGTDVCKRVLSLELLGEPILVIQFSPVHILCPLLLFQMLLVNNLLVKHMPLSNLVGLHNFNDA